MRSRRQCQCELVIQVSFKYNVALEFNASTLACIPKPCPVQLSLGAVVSGGWQLRLLVQ